MQLRPITPSTWRYTANTTFDKVQAQPLIAGWTAAGQGIGGLLSGSMAFSGDAGDIENPLYTLTLDGDVQVNEGAFLNVTGLADLAQTLKVKNVDPKRWGFQSLDLKLGLKNGNIQVQGFKVEQPGFTWDIGGEVGLNGVMDLTGTVRLDPKMVSLPAQFSLLAPQMIESDGRIPVDFTLGGLLTDPRAQLDWAALGKRATEKTKQNQKTEPLEKIKKLLGGGEN